MRVTCICILSDKKVKMINMDNGDSRCRIMSYNVDGSQTEFGQAEGTCDSVVYFRFNFQFKLIFICMI